MSIKRKINRVFKEAASALGLHLERKNALNTESEMFRHLLNRFNIDCVLDVGANTGQFAQALLDGGYRQSIVSFEPLPDAFALLERKSRSHSNWQTENVAVGAKNGDIDFNIAGNSQSSSILRMLPSHEQLAPGSSYVGSVRVPIKSLDSYAAYLEKKESIMLKLDVQGYEESVLAGAKQIILKVKLLQMEVSIIPLYEHSLTYLEALQRRELMGFSLYSLTPIFADVNTGQVFQFDAIFVREEQRREVLP